MANFKLENLLILFLLHVIALPIQADDIDANNSNPWFTGTLLAYFPENAEPGQWLVQPMLFGIHHYGVYDRDSSVVDRLKGDIYSLRTIIETGITKNIDIYLDILGSYSHTAHGDAWGYGDTRVFFGFQIARDKKETWIPDARVVIGESFPTGKYQGLNPALNFADTTGTGAYETSIVFIARKIFYTWPQHPYNWNVSIGITHASKVNVKGLNVFGGEATTNGIIHPGERFFADLGFEYKFNQPWGCGFDINLFYQNSLSVRQKTVDPFVGIPSSYVLSLAPMLEYNVSAAFGFLGGVWFSVSGRNEFAFIGGALSAFYEF